MSLQDLIRAAGVIGAGGAGFPTHAKMTAQAEYILMNGAECEPLLRVDQQLMAIYPDEIIKGFEQAGRAVGASKAIIGVKGKHKAVVNLLRERIDALKLSGFIQVGELPDVYPAGDEQVLVYELTGRVVPEAGLPIHVGCVVINSETALNIHYAALGKPVTEKFLTLAGDIPNRMTIKVPVGTPIIDVLKMSGIEDFSNYLVIDGGPMMGPVMTSLEGFITKKHKGFVILKKEHPLVVKKSVGTDQARRVNKATCEQCRMCTDLCPRYLLGHDMQPHKLMRVAAFNCVEPESQTISYLCCQCNLCELFACPAGLYPRASNMMAKQKLLDQGIRYKVTKETFDARSVRPYRQLPSKRLIARLGLKAFDQDATYSEMTLNPEYVTIALSQHVGAPAVPLVQVGDLVTCGQKIGCIPDGSLGATIHASVSGRVTARDQYSITIRRD